MSSSQSTLTRTASDQNFQTEVLGSPTLALVDFWAEWCGPCQVLGPKVDQVAEEFQGRLSVFKLDVDQNTETATRYGIRGIPAMLLFRNGELVDQIVGNVPKSAIQEAVERHL